MPVVSRIERILAVIVEVSAGNYGARVPIDDVEDELLELEVGINFLLDELALEHDETLAQSEALIAALSTPVIVVWPGVLALPLIGHFDLARAHKVTATLLERVASERASHVILDLTGIETFEPDTIASLLRMVRALRMLGVRCVVTGMHPASARQVVDLGMDLSDVRTHARVSDALARVLAEKGVLT